MGVHLILAVSLLAATTWASAATAATPVPPASPAPRRAAFSPTGQTLAERAAALQPRVVAWRRDLHQNPELSNRETRTAALVAAHLKKLGIPTRTGIAHTGVIGVLKGARPGPVIVLRADMDALPVQEQTGLPFASKARGEYNGAPVPVMHACGHDAHTAMLMGAAEILAGLRQDLAGTVVFLFQPAEEGAPKGEKGGASLVAAEGALADPKPDAVFGLHIVPGPLGELRWKPKGFMAAADEVTIELKGRQTHGSQPWAGIDITSLAADIILSMNQIAARQIDLQKAPHVITIATVHGGVRSNIIPDTLTMTGTIRTFDADNRTKMMQRMRETVNHLAGAYGATASLTFANPNPVTWNDPELLARLTPSLDRAAKGKVNPDAPYFTGAEDFPYLTKDAPGVYVNLGSTPPDQDWQTVPRNHSPLFDLDERAMETGVRTYVQVAVDYLNAPAG